MIGGSSNIYFVSGTTVEIISSLLIIIRIISFVEAIFHSRHVQEIWDTKRGQGIDCM